MRTFRRTAVTTALVGLLLPWAPPSRAEPGPVGAKDLPHLTAELQVVTARAQALLDGLDRAVAADVGLRVAYDRAQQARADAQLALDVRAREVYMEAPALPVASWLDPFTAPDLAVLAHAGERAALQVDGNLVAAVTSRGRQLDALQQRADAFRRRLMPTVRAVLAEQDRARALLAQAEALAAAEHAAAVQQQLAAQRALLDQVSTTTALALTPGQQDRARQALALEAPVVSLLEATGSGIPAGYTPTGEVITGIASWYGPGFVGNPTASGAPYDPERLTCAHQTLPLGTVIHVIANGRAVNCLVDDRGPYAGGRVLDMSRAGSRALGYSGLASVTIEVLVHV